MSLLETSEDKKPSVSKETLHCSFCGKSQHEVIGMIAGPTNFICDECTTLCAAILVGKNFEILKYLIVGVGKEILLSDEQEITDIPEENAAVIAKFKDLVLAIVPDFFTRRAAQN